MTSQTLARVREHCSWLYRHAALAAAANPRLRTPEGEPATWRDHLGLTERGMVEQMMADGLWSPEEAA